MLRCSLRPALGFLGLMMAACAKDDATGPVVPLEDRHADGSANVQIRHVLLLSVDGLHALDLQNFIGSHPHSALAGLASQGITYTKASTSKPSDSFPGLLAQLTGGSPKSTGVYYDDSYDRRLSPPGSACATVGTEVVYDESIDKDMNALDGGGGIDPATLPLDKARECVPVYPHQFLRVNTLFEVAKKAGLRTAWSDKHLSYEIVNGPSGTGVDDLYTPEIGPTGNPPTASAQGAETYDDIKVTAILNEIDGKDHAGVATVGVPAVFGMNFQAVSVGQKTAGYLDAKGTPSSDLLDALTHTDASIGKMVAELKSRGLLPQTLIIISAKHGQSPIDLSQRQIVSSQLIPATVSGVSSGLLGQATQDDIALVWLTDSHFTAQAAAALQANASNERISSVLWGPKLVALFGNPLEDSRAPDLIVQPVHGVIYTKLTATKLAEHGGFDPEDLNVALLVANPRFKAVQFLRPVDTRQIAPTILVALGLNPLALDAVRREGTRMLPLTFGAER